jgi:DNA-binding SARP family transcriptional activator
MGLACASTMVAMARPMVDDVDYRILGPLEVRSGAKVLDLGGRRQRRVLAALLLRPGLLVGLPRLVEAAWDDEPPPTAERQARNRVAALRRILTRFGGLIDTGAGGYVLRVGPGELDTLVFDDLVERGRAAADPTVLRKALALWRGPVLAGLGGASLAVRAAALDDKRLAAYEDCLDLELAAGRADLVPELAELVAAHPLRQRLVGQLMTALYRSDRPAEARRVFDELAGRLADELGIDPGIELRNLREYRPTDALGPAAASPDRPAQLPADLSRFVGREAAQLRLDEVLSDGQTGRTVVISAIAGTAGVGKTALAVRWAHRVRDKFPDGQLYVNLQGYAQSPPVRPIDTLGRFLRALGVPGERVPTDDEQAAALYRETLAGRRVLVVLDNAASVDQVRPLVPGNADCLLLVTSRDALDGLVDTDGARRLTLDVLTADEAETLLVLLLGRARVAAEPDAAGELARLCAYLPLALRIAAANLPDGESLAGYTARLAAGNPLAALAVEGDARAAVRAAFDLSYRALPGPAHRLFRLLGLVPGPELTAEAAGALADAPTDLARLGLERLAAAHLIDHTGDGRYACHDLLRRYAAELAAAHPEPAATDRLHEYYLRGARSADGLLHPGMLHLPLPEPSGGSWTSPDVGDHGAAQAWLDAERANLVAATIHAAQHGPRPDAWLLADALRGYLFNRGDFVDLRDVARAGLAAADAEAQLRPQAMGHLALALAGRQRSVDLPAAIEHLIQAVELAREADWPEAQAAATGTLGAIYREVGQLERAAVQLREALALHRQLGSVYGIANDYVNLGAVSHLLGRLGEAIEWTTQAADLYRRLGAGRSESIARHNLGAQYWALGLFDEALDHVDRAVAMYREIGNRFDAAGGLCIRGEIHRATGRADLAFEDAEAGMVLAQESGALGYQADVLNLLAALHGDRGDYQTAADSRRRALDLSRGTGKRNMETESLIGLAAALCGLGNHPEALACIERALEIATECGYRMLEGRARTGLAEIHLARADSAGAVAEAVRALAIHRETGHRPGEDRTVDLLNRAGTG